MLEKCLYGNFSQCLKNFRKYYRRKLLRTFCRKFLKICRKIFGNIWNYFTNNSRKFSDFFFGCGGAREECKKMLEIFGTF